MNVDNVLASVEKRMRSVPGIIDFQYLDEDFRKEIATAENACEANGACGGLMPFVNTGVWETLRRKYCFIIVIRSSISLLEPSKDLVYIMDKRGQIIGEYLTPERREEYHGRNDVQFFGEDFVLYLDVQPEGEPFFVLPEIPFHFLDDVDGVIDVTSGSISTLSDDIIRKKLGHLDSKHWTHLVGFNIENEGV